MDLSARSIIFLLLACSVTSRSAVNHRGSPFNQQSKSPSLSPAMNGENELENESNVSAWIEAGHKPDHESNHKLNYESNYELNQRLTSESDGEKSINESSKESPKESAKESEELSEKSEAIDRKSTETKCEDHHHDCAGCLSQENCVFCWYEKQCVRQHRTDYESDGKDNHPGLTPRGMSEAELSALSEQQAARLNNNRIVIKPLGTVPKNTCPVRNTLGNISASSCAVNELTLLWLMFTSVILSVIVLFGCLFYCCVFRSKPTDMIIIASDRDNFVLIDEE